jgi:hypothetical protein
MGCCVIWAIYVFHQVKMIWEAPYNWVEGHFSIEKTVVMLQKNFYWRKLRQEVNKYIMSCIVCVISKLTTKK